MKQHSIKFQTVVYLNVTLSSLLGSYRVSEEHTDSIFSLEVTEHKGGIFLLNVGNPQHDCTVSQPSRP
jgi:hypothetical protein